MKHITLCILFLIFSQLISAQKDTSRNFYISGGITSSYFFTDNGGYVSCSYNRFALRFFAMPSTRIYPKVIILFGNSTGYAVGSNLFYNLQKCKRNKIYKPKLSCMYMYRNVIGTDYGEGGGGYEMMFDAHYYSHDIYFGYSNSLNFGNFEFQIIPYLSIYYDVMKGYNIIETQDLYNIVDTPTEQEVITRAWNSRLFLELTFGFWF